MSAQTFGDRPHRARDHLHVHAHGGELWQQRLELAEPHERLAADDRQMQRPMASDDVEDAVDQFLSLEVRELTQDDVAAEVLIAVGVAARAPQRALARDLDRQVGPIAREDPAPGLDDCACFHVP